MKSNNQGNSVIRASVPVCFPLEMKSGKCCYWIESCYEAERMNAIIDCRSCLLDEKRGGVTVISKNGSLAN